MGGAGGNEDGFGQAPAEGPLNDGMQNLAGMDEGMPPNDPGAPPADIGGGFGGDGQVTAYFVSVT